MNRFLLSMAAVLAALTLGACDKQPVIVTTPAPVAVPGPAGPQGEAGKPGENGTVVVVPPVPAASASAPAH